jgi:uncharacterized protein YjbJ (UPF0337 family)
MSMNKDQVNEKLEEKGKVQKVPGEAQAKFSDVKKDVKNLIEGLRSADRSSR